MTIARDIDISLFCVLFLAFIIGNTKHRAEHNLLQHKLFLGLAVSVALILVLDAATRLSEGHPGPLFHILSWATNIALYLISPIIPSLYVLYVDYQIFRDEDRLRKTAIPLICLVAANALLTAATVFTGWTFLIDSQNIYHRGPFVLLHTIPSYVLMIYATVLLLLNRKRIEARYFKALILFPLPPVIGGVLQTLIMGTNLIWSSTALSVLLLYFNIQDRRLDTDYLTGAYNRGILDRTLSDRIRAVDRHGPFAAILIDMVNFKVINDSLGHSAGDSALTDTVELLKGCVRHNDIIARYGGDEFLILMDIGRQSLLDKTIARIRRRLEEFNDGCTRPYRLNMSIGGSVYEPSCGMDAQAFLQHIDSLMYEDKKGSSSRKSELPAGIKPD